MREISLKRFLFLMCFYKRTFVTFLATKKISSVKLRNFFLNLYETIHRIFLKAFSTIFFMCFSITSNLHFSNDIKTQKLQVVKSKTFIITFLQRRCRSALHIHSKFWWINFHFCCSGNGIWKNIFFLKHFVSRLVLQLRFKSLSTKVNIKVL